MNPFNNSQKNFVLARQKARCGNCGKHLQDEPDIEFHHLLKQQEGGAGIVENCVLLCAACHLHIHNHNFKQPLFVYRHEFIYANWQGNKDYKGRKKGKSVEFTKDRLAELDQQRAIMQIDHYENHLRMLEDFKQNLLTLRRYNIEIRDKYKQQLDRMEGAGFVQNIIQPLRDKYQIFAVKIEEIERLMQQHEQKIEMQKQALNTLREIARSY